MFGSIWEQHIPSLFLLGLIVSSRQVLIEIEKQEDELCEWCRQYKVVFEEVDAVAAAHVTRIMRAGSGCLNSAPRKLSGFLPGYAERGALRFWCGVGRA
jgi:hypothetical protein